MRYGIVHIHLDKCTVFIIRRSLPIKELGRMERRSRLERIDRTRKQDKKNLKVKNASNVFIFLEEFYKCLVQKAFQ